MHEFKNENFNESSFRETNQCWSCCCQNLDLKTLRADKSACHSAFDFAKQTDLVKHLQTKHMHEMPYRCSICANSYFNDLNTAKAHFSKHAISSAESTFVFACLICEQIFSEYDMILDHFMQTPSCNLNSQLPVRHSVKCDYCGDIYSNEVAFKIHLEQHKYLLSFDPPAVVIRKTPIFINNKCNMTTRNVNVNFSANNKRFAYF